MGFYIFYKQENITIYHKIYNKNRITPTHLKTNMKIMGQKKAFGHSRGRPPYMATAHDTH